VVVLFELVHVFELVDLGLQRLDALAHRVELLTVLVRLLVNLGIVIHERTVSV
jgi:hypothetical protein